MSVVERPSRLLHGALTSFGAVTGGLAAAALLQLAAAPSAHADGFTDVLSAIDGTFAAGQAEWSDAEALFASGNVPEGLAASFTSFDDYSVVAEGELVKYGYDALMGEGGPFPVESFATLPDPTNLADTATEVTSSLDNAQLIWSDAIDDFGVGHIAAALGALGDANGELVAASQIELIGLVDTLFGSL